VTASFEFALRMVVFLITCLPAMITGYFLGGLKTAPNVHYFSRKQLIQKPKECTELNIHQPLALTATVIMRTYGLAVEVPAERLIDLLDETMFGTANLFRKLLLIGIRLFYCLLLLLSWTVMVLGINQWTFFGLFVLLCVQLIFVQLHIRMLQQSLLSPSRFLLASLFLPLWSIRSLCYDCATLITSSMGSFVRRPVRV
jgi:hypothetical protein